MKLTITTVLFATFASLILTSSLAHSQNGGLRYTLTDLGTFGGYQSEALAINNSGQIVGDYLSTRKRGLYAGQFCFSKRDDTGTWFQRPH